MHVSLGLEHGEHDDWVGEFLPVDFESHAVRFQRCIVRGRIPSFFVVESVTGNTFQSCLDITSGP